MIVAILAFALVLLAVALVLVFEVSAFHALILVVVGLIALAWVMERRDRSRHRSRHDPEKKMPPFRGFFHGESSEHNWQTPTPYIDHPTGTGPPPGVDRHDERPPRR